MKLDVLPNAGAPKPARAAASVRDWPGVDLLRRVPGLGRALKWRPLQFWLMWLNLVFFAVFLYAGLFGSPVGSRNVMIVFVWILWWFLLIALLVPVLSRLWCTMCPLPSLGEWLQRLRFVGVRPGPGPARQRTRLFGLNREWPKALQNIWLQNLGFLCLACCSALLVTRPVVSTAVLGGMIALAIALSLVYRQRAFCMYLCPVSGFLSLYAMSAATAVRVRDAELCRRHKEKECLFGSEKGYGCPWYQYVGSMTRNNYCGMCFECLKTCPHDNVTVYLRPMFSDRHLKGLDEAYKALIMLVLALVYSVTLLGPRGAVKDWANGPETGAWGQFAVYAACILAICLAGFPALHFTAAWTGKRFSAAAATTRELFVRYAYAWVPLGLFAWIAFSVPLVFVNGAYILSALSDPLGQGWNLLGTAAVPWRPVLPDKLGFLQVPLLLTGLYFAFQSTWRIAASLHADGRAALRSVLPTWTLATAVTGVFVFFFVG